MLGRGIGALDGVGGGVGGAGELGDEHATLTRELARAETTIALVGDAATAIASLLEARVFGAATPSLRARAEAELRYEARWRDGRLESQPPDRTVELTAACAGAAHAHAAAAEQARTLDARLREANVAADKAQKKLATTQHKLARLIRAAKQHAKAEVAAAELASVTVEHTPPSQPSMPARPSWWRRLWARLLAFFARLVGKAPPALATSAPRQLPAPEEPDDFDGFDPAAHLPLVERKVMKHTRVTDSARLDAQQLETALAECRAREAALADTLAERRAALARYRDPRAQKVDRLAWLFSSTDAPAELDVFAPEIPADLLLVSHPRPEDAVDARLTLAPPSATVVARGPVMPMADPSSRADLVRALGLVCRQRPTKIARRIAAALCLCRDRIGELERRARHAHEERTRELDARRVRDRDAVLVRERGNAGLPMAREAERVVQSAASQLELLVAEVRRDWQARIAGCQAVEQLRAEVAAIENGAAHRLSIVCDELREAMTVQLVRLVLELSRPLRQELHHQRLEVARGNSPKLDEAFEEVRLVFPSSVEATFAALKTPGLGELMNGERGFLDPLFRTLAKEKRECLGRLLASLDDIEHTTARQLYEAAANLSPLLLTTFERIVAELLTAHERWIDGQLAAAARDDEAQRRQRQPVLAFIDPLEDAEAKLLARLETLTGEYPVVD